MVAQSCRGISTRSLMSSVKKLIQVILRFCVLEHLRTLFQRYQSWAYYRKHILGYAFCTTVLLILIQRPPQQFSTLSAYLLHTVLPQFLHTALPQFLHTVLPQFLHTVLPQFLHTVLPQFNHTDRNILPMKPLEWRSFLDLPHSNLLFGLIYYQFLLLLLLKWVVLNMDRLQNSSLFHFLFHCHFLKYICLDIFRLVLFGYLFLDLTQYGQVESLGFIAQCELFLCDFWIFLYFNGFQFVFGKQKGQFRRLMQRMTEFMMFIFDFNIRFIEFMFGLMFIQSDWRGFFR